MKTTIARFIALFLAFGLIANVSIAAVTTTYTGIDRNPIGLSGAASNTAPDHLSTSTGQERIFLSFKVADSAGQYMTLNSVTIETSVNGNILSTTKYTSWDIASLFSRIGYYGSDYFTDGAMNGGAVLSAFGCRDSFNPYLVSINPGDTWQAKMYYDVQGVGVINSTGTLTYIPEPSTIGLIVISFLGFLRRKR